MRISDWSSDVCSSDLWRDEQLHVEYFQAAAVDSTDDGAFRVKVTSSGNVYDVPAGRTVVQVLGENGIDIPVSCEQGICGTCITGVLEGQCDHRDLYFTDEEKERNDQFTPCCSRAKSPQRGSEACRERGWQ